MNYALAYKIGFHPWEDALDMPPFVERITELFVEEERRQDPPYGPALDIGTGSGIWGIELAKRGWEVTGIDIVNNALRRARARVKEASVDMRLVKGDVTALREADVGSGYRLVLDTGTFHGLPSAEREAMGQEVSAIAAPGATVLMVAWNPRRRGPFPRGVSHAEIERAFPGWSATDLGPSGFHAPKPLRAVEHWYRLRRA